MILMEINLRDLALRFVLGGASVALCFILLQILPWKIFAGIFAAFPAVMIAAVVMAGYFGNSELAAEVTLGASAGMMGCTVCVFTAAFCMQHLNRWGLSLSLALGAWFVSSFVFVYLMQHFLAGRRVGKSGRAAP